MSKAGINMVLLLGCVLIGILGIIEMVVSQTGVNLFGISYSLFLLMIIVNAWPTGKKDGTDSSKEQTLS